MKRHLKVLFVLCSLLSTQKVQAECAEPALNATVHNNSGDRFQIISDCNAFKIIDLQLGDVYVAERGQFRLQQQPTVTSHLVGTLGKIIPISLRLGKTTSNGQELFMRLQIPSKQSEKESGLTAPIIEVKLKMWKPQSSISFVVVVESIQAVESPTDSALQKAFNKGINLGLELMSRFSSQSFYQILIQE